MITKEKLAIVVTFTCFNICRGISDPLSPPPSQALEPAVADRNIDGSRETELRADKRYDEMLSKMQGAIEEVAQLYGNPKFLQVFTNDADQASELKNRLKIARSLENLRHELEDLEKKRDELLNDIAVKQRETERLTKKLTRQRKALDALTSAFEQVRDAIEETAK